MRIVNRSSLRILSIQINVGTIAIEGATSMTLKRTGASSALSILILMLALPCLAAENNTRVIEVSGTGEARSTPDIANLSLQVETHAATAEECSSKNAALAQKVVQALKNKLAGKGTVETGDYSLSPEYGENNQPRQKPVITGYTAQNTITVETTELALLGSLIDGAISSGANRINYLNFGLRDDTKARQDAITNASKDAQAQAQALAASLNVKLKHVVKASTVPERGPIMPMQRMGAVAFSSASPSAPTPVEASQITVTATVSLTYEIE
jgi:uncharacterized protein YggE